MEKKLTLEDLKAKLLLPILLFCDLETIVGCNLVSKKINTVIKRQTLWKKLCVREDPNLKREFLVPSGYNSWKEYYILECYENDSSSLLSPSTLFQDVDMKISVPRSILKKNNGEERERKKVSFSPTKTVYTDEGVTIEKANYESEGERSNEYEGESSDDDEFEFNFEGDDVTLTSKSPPREPKFDESDGELLDSEEELDLARNYLEDNMGVFRGDESFDRYERLSFDRNGQYSDREQQEIKRNRFEQYLIESDENLKNIQQWKGALESIKKNHITGLKNRTIERILRFCNARTTVDLSATNNRFYYITNTEKVWKENCLYADLNVYGGILPEKFISWKELYIAKMDAFPEINSLKKTIEHKDQLLKIKEKSLLKLQKRVDEYVKNLKDLGGVVKRVRSEVDSKNLIIRKNVEKRKNKEKQLFWTQFVAMVLVVIVIFVPIGLV